NVATGLMSFGADELATFTCSLDGAAFSGCTSPTALGPLADGAHTFQVQATDGAGNKSSVASFAWTVDTTPPVVTAALARPADQGGWYNHPVATAFTGTDATSGGVNCTTATYTGPDAAGTSLTASCTDAAGNSVSATTPTFKYDATAPSVA